MSDTLTLNKLEKLIEVETKLRGEYGQQLDQKDAAIAKLNEDKASLVTKLAGLEGTVAKQLATITELSGKSSNTQALEQRNRELHNRSENMKDEVASVKSRIKSLQKDLAAERAELTELKKYDPQRLRKNLDGSKKKLAEKTAAADKLQKLLNQARAENTELKEQVKGLESQLSELNQEEGAEPGDNEQAAA
jgi:chromosome segregation ATPase